MKALITRIDKGEARAFEGDVSSVDQGIAVFVGIEKTDTQEECISLAERIINLRIFESETGKLHFSVKEKGYEILCIPNFTLCANTDKGRRPSFDDSMPPMEAKRMFDEFVLVLASYGVAVKTGTFGAHMSIGLMLDGPVNIILSSER